METFDDDKEMAVPQESVIKASRESIKLEVEQIKDAIRQMNADNAGKEKV